MLIKSLFAAVALAGSSGLRVVTTTTDLAALAREVGGKRASVESLAKGSMNPHFVEAKPSLILKLMRADAFIETGLELESGWAPLILRGARNPAVAPGGKGYIDASTAVESLEAAPNATRASGDVHPGGNPHYLQDPDNALKAARLFTERFSALDPDGAAQYRANLESFERRLSSASARWDALMAPARGASIVVYHKNWSYFEKRFGLKRLGEIEPKPGIPPTASHAAALVERMRSEKARAVLTEAWFEARTPASIAAAAGVRVIDMALLPEARAGSGPGYFDWMDYNVRVLSDGLR